MIERAPCGWPGTTRAPMTLDRPVERSRRRAHEAQLLTLVVHDEGSVPLHYNGRAYSVHS
jgi:hypothetical protein